MIKKLRRKFILISMVSLAVLLVLVVGTINFMNYRQVNDEIDKTLVHIADNGGTLPEKGKETQNSDSGQAPAGDQGAGHDDDGENSFKKRYYSVIFNADGTVESVNTARIATVTSEQAEENAKDVLESGKSSAFSGDYKYLVTTQSDGSRLVVFLECGDKLGAAKSFLLTSGLVSLISYCVVFVFVYLFASRAIKPVAESITKQKQFITDAGHELKTPLTVIAANVDVLSITEGANEWTDSIKSQVKRMNRLVKELVSLSRLDEEQPKLEFSPFSFSDAAEDIAAEFTPVAEGRGLTVKKNIQEKIELRGDEASIRQMMAILADNAVKYTDDGGEIVFALTGKKHGAVLEISNTCAAADKLEYDKLFDRFYRAEKSRNRESGGYGIGLSIARAVAEKNGGRISARKSAENTVCFTVTF